MNKNLEPNNTPAATPEEGFARLNRIMVLLRENCPWDRKQTFETLRPLTIEEVFELSDAILGDDNDAGDFGDAVANNVGEQSGSKSDEKICEELGDLIMHIAFYARVAEEQNRFTFTDILNKICDKLIRRHPHIFSDTTAETDEEVKKNWEEIKLKEKVGEQRSVLAGVPRSLPSMIKAWRVQDKARGVGFDWEEPQQVWDKVQEELAELQEAVVAANEAQNSPNNIEVLNDQIKVVMSQYTFY